MGHRDSFIKAGSRIHSLWRTNISSTVNMRMPSKPLGIYPHERLYRHAGIAPSKPNPSTEINRMANTAVLHFRFYALTDSSPLFRTARRLSVSLLSYRAKAINADVAFVTFGVQPPYPQAGIHSWRSRYGGGRQDRLRTVIFREHGMPCTHHWLTQPRTSVGVNAWPTCIRAGHGSCR